MSTHQNPFIEISSDHLRIPARRVSPPENWEKAKGFPDCCAQHRAIVQVTKEFLLRFPNCCKAHKEYAKRFQLKKGEFNYLIDKIVECVSYTEYIILNHVENNDWHEDVRDYIEYIIESFGIMPIGADIYYSQVLWFIQNNTKTPTEKKQPLYDFIEAELNKKPKRGEKTPSLNVLDSIYQKWLNAFPFELSFFKVAHEFFKNRKPFLQGYIRTNRYTGLSLAKVHDEESFVEVLTGNTKELLNLIRSTDLIKSGEVSKVEKIKLELLIERHEINRKELLESFNKNERKYIKTIKKWLQNELDFFDGIKSLNKSVLPKKTNPKPKKNLSFKMKHGREQKVRSIVKELVRVFYFLDEEKTTIDDLMNVLTSSKIDGKAKIHFGCYNNQVALIIDNLQTHFHQLTISKIEESKIFYSKQGTLLKASNLYQSKSQGEPEKKEAIEAVFMKFQ